MTYREAVKQAIRDAIKRDERVFLMGEDVGRYGGCYAVSKGLLDEFGPERIRDTPLSESGFTGAGIGAAMAGMRPIVEVMTVNFSLLALDQIMNTAATVRHMSGNQFGVPVVIRMATGAGKQLAAQHSHSLEGWYAHIPGIKVLAPATLEDARGMLWTALRGSRPGADLRERHALQHERQARRRCRAGRYRQGGGAPPRPRHLAHHLWRLAVEDAGQRRKRWRARAIEAEVIDLRTLRPLDDATIMASVAKTRRAVIVDEGWRSGSLAAEIGMRIVEQAFWSLDAPLGRVCSEEVPIPYPRAIWKSAAIPQAPKIVAAAKAALGRGVRSAVADFRMPSLGADMEAGTLVEWLVKPGDQVKHGDIIAVVETQKGAIEIETFQTGEVEKFLVDVGTKVPVGTPLARIRTEAEAKAGPAPVAPTGRTQGGNSRQPHRPLRHLCNPRRRHRRCDQQTSASCCRGRMCARRPRRASSPKQRGIDLSTSSGTGPDGAITYADVEQGAAAAPAAAPAAERNARRRSISMPCARRSPPPWRARSGKFHITIWRTRST